MATSPVFRRTLMALLPATLLLASCSKDDEPVAPAVDQGRINFYHAAANANVSLKFLFDDADKATLSYGANSGYQSLATGAHTLKVNTVNTPAVTVATQPVTVEKDKSYSYFAYANAPTTQAGLLVADDLRAPSSGKARIRFVNLGLGTSTPLKLSTTAASTTDIAGTETAFGNSSGFVEVAPGSYNVAVTNGATSATVANGNVGDGSGAGTVANKNYEAGKIYTVLYRGMSGATVAADLQPKVILIQNN